MSSQVEPNIQVRWAEGIVLLGILGAGVTALQDLLPTMPTLCISILTFYLGMNIALLFSSPSAKKESRDGSTEKSDTPFFQLEYQKELERARKNRSKPIWKSPEGPYSFYSTIVLLFFVADLFVLGLIVMQVQRFTDDMFQILGCICALFTGMSALGWIRQYAYKAAELYYRPFQHASALHILYRRCSRLFGLVYCFYAIALMGHLL